MDENHAGVKRSQDVELWQVTFGQAADIGGTSVASKAKRGCVLLTVRLRARGLSAVLTYLDRPSRPSRLHAVLPALGSRVT
jgi:hypothetical protein